jgi:glycosyltransferase involved in cell wall biosynthesis
MHPSLRLQPWSTTVPGIRFAFRNDRAVDLGPVIDVILPALDEAEALPSVLAAVPGGFRAIVVDNGSTDGTADVARSLGAQVVHEPKRGFGAACFAGLAAARTSVVCFMDCDGSLDPQQLHRVADPVRTGSADLCLGARSPEPGAWPWHARIANRALAFELRRRTGAPVTDLGPMRAARRDALLTLELRNRGSGWPLEMVLRAAAAGWRIGEASVTYRPRAGGRSKVTGSVRGTARAIREMSTQLVMASPITHEGSDPPARDGPPAAQSQSLT